LRAPASRIGLIRSVACSVAASVAATQTTVAVQQVQINQLRKDITAVNKTGTLHVQCHSS
jgi:hypothetical protein